MKNILKKSLEWKTWAILCGIEASFILIISIVYQTFLQQVLVLLQKVNLWDIKAAVATGAPLAIAKNVVAIRDMYNQFIFSILLLIVTVVLAYSFFNAFIWIRIQHKKFTADRIKKHLKYTIPWNAAWTALAFSYIYLFDTQYIGIMLLIHLAVFLCFTTLWHLSLDSQKVVKTFKKLLHKLPQFLVLWGVAVIALYGFAIVLVALNIQGPTWLWSMVAVTVVVTTYLRIVSYHFKRDYLKIK